MSIESDGISINGIFLETVLSPRNEKLLFWGNIAAKNAATRLDDTLLYANLMAEEGETPVPEAQLSEVEDRLRTRAEYESNQTKAIADLLAVNRGGIGYPLLKQL